MKAIILAQKDLGTLLGSQSVGKKAYTSSQIGDTGTFNSLIKRELGVENSNLRETDNKPPSFKTTNPTRDNSTNEKEAFSSGDSRYEKKLSSVDRGKKEGKEVREEGIKNEQEAKALASDNPNNALNADNKADDKKLGLSSSKELEKEAFSLKSKEDEDNIKAPYLKSIYNLLKQILDKIKVSSKGKASNKSAGLAEEVKELLSNLKQVIEKGGLKGSEGLNTKELKDLYNFLNKDSIKNGNVNIDNSLAYKDILLKLSNLIGNQTKEAKLSGGEGKSKKLSYSKWSVKKLSNSGEKSNYNEAANINKGSSPAEVIGNNAEGQELFAQKTTSYNFADTKEQFSNSFALQGNKLKLPDGLSRLEGQELFNQVVKKAIANIAPNRSEVRIQLEPRVFGNITLNILMDNGVVSGNFSVDSRLIKQVLEENLALLKEGLEEQGLVMDNIDISYRDNDGSFSGLDDRELLDYSSDLSPDLEADELMDKYIMPDWMAREVNMVI